MNADKRGFSVQKSAFIRVHPRPSLTFFGIGSGRILV